MDFASLLDTINMLLDRLIPGAKLQPKTTPQTLAAELASAVSLLLGVNPDEEDPNEKRKIGPVDDGQANFAQMSGAMGYSLSDFSRVVALINKLLKAAEMRSLESRIKPQELPGRLVEIIMDDLRGQMKPTGPDVAQMGGRLAKMSAAKRELSDQYETFKRAGFRPEKAMKMARNVTSSGELCGINRWRTGRPG